jgi:hypothetical protein
VRIGSPDNIFIVTVCERSFEKGAYRKSILEGKPGDTPIEAKSCAAGSATHDAAL